MNKFDLFIENENLRSLIAKLRSDVCYWESIVNQYRIMPVSELERKRRLLWDKMQWMFNYNYREAILNPNNVPYKGRYLLLDKLIEKGYARINKANYTEQETDRKSYWTMYLTTPQGYEFSIGQNSSNFATSSIFELAAQVLTFDEINEL